MSTAPTVRSLVQAFGNPFVFAKTQGTSGGASPEPSGGAPTGGGPGLGGLLPSSGPFSNPLILGIIAVIVLGIICACLGGVLLWALFGRNNTVVSAATVTPYVVPTQAATPHPTGTPTPSYMDYLRQIPPRYAPTGRQLLQMGLDPTHLPSVGAFYASDPTRDLIYSIIGVDPGIYSPQADMVDYGETLVHIEADAEGPIFNNSLFECGAQGDRTVVCGGDVQPMPPGDVVLASIVLAEPIPAPSAEPPTDQSFTIPTGDRMLVYAFIVDRDGDPANNFVAQSPYNWDFYQGTDTWYELVGDPEYGVWILYTTDAKRQPQSSTARAVIEGNTINFYVSAAEVGAPEHGDYRMSAFQTDGSYDASSSAGDVTGANPQEPLLPLTDTGWTLTGPPQDIPDLSLPTPLTSTGTPTASESTPSDPEAMAEAFIGEFSTAQEQKNVDFLVAHLAQATLDRYGEAQCRSYLENYAGTTTAIQPLSTTYPETFGYMTDGVSTTVEDTVRVDIRFMALGTPTTGSMHVLIADGQPYWFTDCGTPLN